MGLKRIVRGLTASADDLDRQRLTGRFGELDLGQAALGECPLRRPVRVTGEVAGMRVVPRAGTTSLEVSVEDGTGEATAIFSGRRRIRGLDPGRGVVLEGVARRERGRIVLLNPAYTILP